MTTSVAVAEQKFGAMIVLYKKLNAQWLKQINQ